MSRPSAIASVMAAVLFWSCGSGNIAGNSSETTNGLTIVARAGIIEGTAPSFSSLYLFDDFYDPLSGMPFDSIKTDTTGAFSFQVSGVRYNLFCYGVNGLRSRVHLTMNAESLENDTIRDTLREPGSIKGYTPPGTDMYPHKAYLYLEGTPFITVADSLSGYFRIDEIPEGQYTLKLVEEINIDQSVVPYGLDTLSQESTKYINVKRNSVLPVEWKW